MSPSRELWCLAHGSDLRQQAKELTDVLKDEIRRDKVFFFLGLFSRDNLHDCA